MRIFVPLALLSVKNDDIIEKGIGVVLPTEDDEQFAEGVHGVAVSRGWRLSFGFHLLPRERLDVLKVDPPHIV